MLNLTACLMAGEYAPEDFVGGLVGGLVEALAATVVEIWMLLTDGGQTPFAFTARRVKQYWTVGVMPFQTRVVPIVVFVSARMHHRRTRP
jgi:hypothetical protein